MTTWFTSVLDMSLDGAVLILLVLCLRQLFGKASKRLAVLMWAVAAVRLLCPLTLKSAFSLMPSLAGVPSSAAENMWTLTVMEETLRLPVAETPVTTMPFMTVGAVLWLMGVLVMLVYTVSAYRRTKRTLQEAVCLYDNVYECDRIPTPFIFGVCRPRIYVPSAMATEDRRFVIAHETAHIARWDHLWKPLGFLVLSLHWFNPLVWVAYVLFCRDMEAACDERVLIELGSACKKAYADVLINCAAPTRRIAACPLSFGETNVKKRVRAVLRYRQPSFWLSAATLTACLLLMLCFLTDPIAKASEPPKELPPVTTPATTRPSSADANDVPFTEPTLPMVTKSMTVDAVTPQTVRGGESVTVRVSVQDSRSVQGGVEVLLFYEEDDGTFVSLGEPAVLTLVQGSAYDGIYEGTILIPTSATAGAYRLRASYLPVSEKPAICTAYTPEGEAAVFVD